MPAGEIRKRHSREPATVRPGLELPYVMRGAEPIFRWLMDTAAETKAIEADIHNAIQDLVEATLLQNDLLRVIADDLEESNSARSDAKPSGESPEKIGGPPTGLAETQAEDPRA